MLREDECQEGGGQQQPARQRQQATGASIGTAGQQVPIGKMGHRSSTPNHENSNRNAQPERDSLAGPEGTNETAERPDRPYGEQACIESNEVGRPEKDLGQVNAQPTGAPSSGIKSEHEGNGAGQNEPTPRKSVEGWGIIGGEAKQDPGRNPIRQHAFELNRGEDSEQNVRHFQQ